MPNYLLFSDRQWDVTYDLDAIDEVIASHNWLSEDKLKYVIIICGNGPQICRKIQPVE